MPGSNVGGQLRVVTTSWDDGDPHDLRVAELLRARDLPATFYVPIIGYRQRKTLAAADLRALSSVGFEIGAHTVSHTNLPRLGPKELDREVRTCKEMLEQTLGSGVLMFCYPNGRYDAEVIRQVKNAGYTGARTTRMLSVSDRLSSFRNAYDRPSLPASQAGLSQESRKSWKYYGSIQICSGTEPLRELG